MFINSGYYLAYRGGEPGKGKTKISQILQKKKFRANKYFWEL